MNTDKLFKTILIVEDEAIISIIISKTLKRLGYDVISANTGEKAIEIVLQNEFISMVLMDINLGPGIDGTETARRILSRRNLPIVFHTSHSEREMVEKVRGITRYGYVVKSSGDFVLQSSIEMAYELFDANEKTKKNEEQFRSFFNSSIVGAAITTPDGKWIYVNDRLCGMLGYSRDELNRLTWLDLTPAADLENELMRYKAVLQGEAPSIFEKKYICKDGSMIDVVVSAGVVRNLNGSISHFSSIFQDITENKIAKIRLAENEQHYKALFEHTGTSLLIIDEDTTISLVNDEFARIAGYSRKEIEGKKSWTEFVDREEVDRMFSQHKLRRDSFDYALGNYEFRFKTAGGALLDTSIYITMLPGTKKSIASLVDITERKQIKQQLRDKNEELSAMNEELEAANEELMALNEELIVAIEELHIKENELRKSEEKYRLIFDNSPLGLIYFDEKGIIMACNDNFVNVIGSSREVLVGLDMNTLKTEGLVSALQVSLNGNPGFFEGTYESVTANKSTPVRVLFAPMKDEDNVQIGGVGIIEDISERKHVQKALIESGEYLNAVINSVHDAIFVDDADTGEIIDVNRSMCEMYGYTREEAISMPVGDLSQGESPYSQKEAMEWLKKARETGPQTFEWLGKRKNGELFSVEISMRFALIGGKNRFVVTAHDITNRKINENKIQSLLNEKELILKEVHHRIKNNMNTIKSLLLLQAQTMKEQAAADALEDAGNRVQSMMVLYDKLYQSDHFHDISVLNYFSALADEIISGFPNSRIVQIEKNIQDFPLEATLLSYLGIIFNELLTNIMKYAFAGRSGGVITLSVARKDNHVSILIRDNGVGIPESVGFEKSPGFGLDLVSMLTKQLEGTIRIERDGGTGFILEFDV